MKTKSIKQSVFFNATPHDVFEALMDSKKHSKFTGSKAKIGRKAGENFSAYDGSLNGKNLAVIPDKKIVQEWRCEEDTWPEGHYSKATFSLKAEKNGTKLNFIQTGVPEAAVKSISQGWVDYYWNPMAVMLEK